MKQGNAGRLSRLIRQTALGMAFATGLWLTACGGSFTRQTSPAKTTPTVTVTPSALSVTTTQALAVSVAVSGSNPAPTGSVVLTSGSYTTSPAPLSGGGATLNIPTGSLASGKDTLTVVYTPDAHSSSSYESAQGTASVTVSAISNITSITVTPNSATIGTQVQFAAVVNGTGSFSSSVTWSVAAPSGSGLGAGDISSTGLYNTPYPAPPSVTVTATSVQDTSISGSVVVKLVLPSAGTGPELVVDLNTPNTPSEHPHSISPYIYGINAFQQDSSSFQIANPSIIRWGGDGASRYNYQNNMTNAGSTYFTNRSGLGDFPLVSGGTNFLQFVQSTDSLGASALGTMPVIGYVSNSIDGACSFPESTTPGQQEYNSANCGNGVYLEGYGGCTSPKGCDIYGNSTTAAITSIQDLPPSITSTTTPPPGSSSSALTTWADGTWAGGWVISLTGNPSLGSAASGKGVAVWDLDNEPSYWDSVHRDVHPKPFTYDEVTNNGIGTALAIKMADPGAMVSGPVIPDWWDFFYSREDYISGAKSTTGHCPRQIWNDPTDRTAHDGIAMIPYYLQQFNTYSQEYGVRLLDYLDIHGYFEPVYNGSRVGLTTAGNTQEQIVRLNGTRVFWDPTYTDPRYLAPNYVAGGSTNCSPSPQAPQLIPMLQAWVNGTAPLGDPNNDYPGTRTAIDEYNFGGLESINGAVVEADLLGIFGRQGLDLATLWDNQSAGNYAFAMYRNYDLANDGATFGDQYLYATSTASGVDAEGQLAIYGALRSTDNAITIMIINKTYGSLTSILKVQNFSAPRGTTASVYQYSSASSTNITSLPGVAAASSTGSSIYSSLTATFPGQSITLIVIPQ